MSAVPLLQQAMQAALAFEPQGDRAGNVQVGRGSLDGRTVRIALVENRAASGAIGGVEAERLAALFKVAATERSAVVLWLDSAGAKVSEGLKALGAFRVVFRAGLDAVLAGTPVAALLGRNCYGGSSMLAHLASQRLFSPQTQLAMSGPAVIASASGLSAIDESFRAMAEAVLASGARAKASGANRVWEPGADVTQWLRDALAPRGDVVGSARLRHEGLAARLAAAAAPQWEAVRRRDFERIYDGGYETRESLGLIEGQGRRDGRQESILGLVGKQPLGAQRAWRFSQAVWSALDRPPQHLEVFLDCASHAARLDEERTVLTEFVVDMSLALGALGAAGTRVGLTIAGQASGGVYVALAAPVTRVASVHGADIQMLPVGAVAAILGESRGSAASFDDYRAAGVADEEIKLGIVPPEKPR